MNSWIGGDCHIIWAVKLKTRCAVHPPFSPEGLTAFSSFPSCLSASITTRQHNNTVSRWINARKFIFNQLVILNYPTVQFFSLLPGYI